MPRVAWKSFTEGRAFARGLGLQSHRGWREWSKSGQRPSGIPSNPEKAYRDDGWISWPDWLGNGKRYDMLPFAVGRAYARKLKLKTQKEWREWNKSGQRPFNIPTNPDKMYRDDGWISWPDWLGFEGRAPPGSMLPFAVGRAYARKLKLKTQKEWREWNKSGQRPFNIPSAPEQTYRDDGWISMPDWLGYGEGRVLAKDMLPFAAGRAYVRKLKLKNRPEWREWSKSGQRPFNVPANPARTYRDDGWISMPDWLGFGSEGGAATSRSSSSSSSATTAPKKTKKKRKRRPSTSHPSDLPPPPPPSTSSKPTVKAEPPSSESSGGSSTDPEPPLRKIKKEEDA
jgi:hypothetical protein